MVGVCWNTNYVVYLTKEAVRDRIWGGYDAGINFSCLSMESFMKGNLGRSKEGLEKQEDHS
jgi:hypothetical protein